MTNKPPAGSKGAQYHRKCTGLALKTVESHSDIPSNGLTIFGAAFCPFVHRAWIALEHLQIPYRYIEVDPYSKPAELLQVNPKGLVPSLRLENGDNVVGLAESTVIMEYLHERFVDAHSSSEQRLLPALTSDENTYKRARARQVSHHLNNTLVPSFYRFLQAQEEKKQIEHGKEFLDNIQWFQDTLQENDAGGDSGDFFAGSKQIGWVDVMIAPWAFRATNVLKHFRALGLDATFPPKTSRYGKWAAAVFSTEAFKRTTSTEDLYLDSYARYAENRPNTSQVASAINSGRALP
ncbi:unnamed protein product [Sympodiomycopsis kandeliae]